MEKKNHIDFSTLKNPFINPTFEKLRQVKITAIMFNRVKIEDKWYQEGDRFDGAIISQIGTKELKFRYDNAEIVIKLNKNDKININ